MLRRHARGLGSMMSLPNFSDHLASICSISGQAELLLLQLSLYTGGGQLWGRQELSLPSNCKIPQKLNGVPAQYDSLWLCMHFTKPTSHLMQCTPDQQFATFFSSWHIGKVLSRHTIRVFWQLTRHTALQRGRLTFLSGPKWLSSKFLWHTCGQSAAHQCVTAHWVKISAPDSRGNGSHPFSYQYFLLWVLPVKLGHCALWFPYVYQKEHFKIN